MSDITTDDETIDLEEHQPDDGPDNSIQFVRSGNIRLVIDGTVFILRRPFLGELRTLRGALEQATDEADLVRVEVSARAEDRKAQAEAIEADTSLSSIDKQTRLGELRIQDRGDGRRLARAGDDSRVDWWNLVFDTLATNGRRPDPERLPGWVIDARLAGKVLTHWRSSPLAHG